MALAAGNPLKSLSGIETGDAFSKQKTRKPGNPLKSLSGIETGMPVMIRDADGLEIH